MILGSLCPPKHQRSSSECFPDPPEPRLGRCVGQLYLRPTEASASRSRSRVCEKRSILKVLYRGMLGAEALKFELALIGYASQTSSLER